MKLAAVTMVKDELDVLEYTMRQLAHQGVDLFIVADNMSTDGTWEMLSSFDDLDVEVSAFRDEEVGYYQSEKMSALVERARQFGADWVIPFDADECWYGVGPTIAAQLEWSAGIQAATIRNYYATSEDGEDANPFVRIRHHDVEYLSLPKVIVPAVEGVVVHQGNHGATLPGVKPFYSRTLIEIGHFPYRGFEQFVRKVRNGAAAYAASDLPESMGEHWRGYGRVLEVAGEQALHDDVWAKWFFDPPVSLIDDPAPYLC